MNHIPANIIQELPGLFYDEVGAVLVDYGYPIEVGDAITPQMLEGAIREKGFDFAADLASEVNMSGGNITVTDLMEAVPTDITHVDEVLSEEVETNSEGIFITWNSLGWGLVAVLLILLIFRQ